MGKGTDMPGLNKRELTSKPLRIDVRMARDIEKLAGATGYSQNEIIVMGIKQYLYENRQYFVQELIENRCIARIERDTKFMRGESHFSFGDVDIDFTKADTNYVPGSEVGDDTCYNAEIKIHNAMHEVIYRNSQRIDMFTSDWEDYRKYLLDIITQYMDINSPLLESEFRERFKY